MLNDLICSAPIFIGFFFFYFSLQIPLFEMSAYLKFKFIAACLNKTFSNKISNGHFVADMKFMGIIVNMTILLKRNMVKKPEIYNAQISIFLQNLIFLLLCACLNKNKKNKRQFLLGVPVLLGCFILPKVL